MIDCRNAEIRDRLPDLLHERLDSESRAAVVAHVEGCALCQAELALLREVRAAMPAPRVNVQAIALAVAARTRDGRRAIRSARRWADWRIAAAITVFVLGGSSVVAVYSVRRGTDVPDSVRVADTYGATAVAANESVRTTVAPSIRGAPAGQSELSMGGGVSELSETELRALLDGIDRIDAVPLTEPEPEAVRVTPARSPRGSIE